MDSRSQTRRFSRTSKTAAACGCRAVLATVLFAVCSALISISASAEPHRAIDHSLWQQVLDRHLLDSESSGHLRIDYHAVSRDSGELLNRYIEQMIEQPYWSYTAPEQQAYWINLYNALTVRLISDFFPISSTDEIKFVSGNYREVPLVTLMDQPLSLIDIERVIAFSYRDNPTLMFAMSCGTSACPAIAPKVYTGATLESDLSSQMERYLASDKLVRFEEDSLVVPKMVQNFQNYHFEDQVSLLRRLAYYAPAEKALRLLGHQGGVTYWDSSLIQPVTASNSD